jgi:hypothetical protein
VREIETDVEGVKIAAFQIMRLGCGQLDGHAPSLLYDLDAAMEDFRQRYRAWREQYQVEEQEAQRCGLRHNPYLLLLALADGQEHTFADLARATGIFSGLPQDLHQRHPGSLGSEGLLREDYQDIDGKKVYTFQITAKGTEVLAKALD